MFNYEDAFSRNIGWLTQAEQQVLKHKTVAIAGAGGVGSEHIVTLARLGIGKFNISDFDEYEVHNFNRQAGAFVSTLNRPKVDVMEEIALDINPEAHIKSFPEGIFAHNVDEFLEGVDIYVDSLDFFALEARKLVFQKCYEKQIPVITAAPVGMGAAFLCFMPGKMSYEAYFRFNDAKSESEQLIKFLVGLSPSMLQRSYLVDDRAVDFQAKKGPSTPMGVKLCAGVAGTYALKILLNRGPLVCAPHGLHIDAYTNKVKKTWRPFGNRNPMQKLMYSIARKIVLKSKPANVSDNSMTPIETVFDYAKWAPSGDNTQPWRIEIINDMHCIMHCYDTRDWVIYDLKGNASKLAIGCLLENFSIAAKSLGFAISIKQLPQENDHNKTSDNNDNEVEFIQFDISLTPATEKQVDPLFPFIKTRTVQRKTMGTRALTVEEKSKLEACLPEGYSLIWLESTQERLKVAKLMFDNAYTRISMKEAYGVHSKIIEYQSLQNDKSAEKNNNECFSKDKIGGVQNSVSA